MAFADELKAARLRAGLSQVVLAEKAAVDQSIISRAERGTVKPGLASARRLAIALGLDSEAFIPELVDAPEGRVLGRLPVLGWVPAGPAEDGGDGGDGETLDLATLFPPGCVVLRVTGGSMAGRGILDGDLAVVRLANDPADVRVGDVVVARVDGGYTLKAVLADGPNGLYLASFYRGAPEEAVKVGEGGVELVGVLVKVIGDRRVLLDRVPSRRKR